ncbi:hypothetical protein CEP54_013489 [Fusarium duplospermum]|uniref:F-box domain-containing protein n=1 Tax=Fusarium duplospermum TaxID=1325734 RepID=A0A428P2H4_9HYPO|nr:hypothetical protein CEP54_013489 [Fusarium duplospermum]
MPNGPSESCFKAAERYSTNKTKIKIAALSAMTQTCMVLRSIAQPYLYHYPSVRAPDVYKRLLRTLVERPDLAQCIKELSAFEMICDYDIRDEVSDISQLQGEEEKIIRHHIQECDRYHDFLSFEERADIMYDVNILFTTLVLPFGANLEILHFELMEENEFPSCEPGSLPRLKELVVHNPWEMQEVGTGCISSLLNAAPALERLGGHKICGDDWKGPRPPIHEGVKEVLFERCVLSPQAVTKLLGPFPRLEAFTYELFDARPPDLSSPILEAASMSEIAEALLACPDLRFLSIDFTDLIQPNPSDDKNPADHLVRLKKLQKFRVKAFSPYDKTEPLFAREAPRIKLCDMLPDSITELEVTRPSSIIFDAMLELSAVASQRFPLLKHVSIDGIEQERQKVLVRRVQAGMGLARINELRQAFQQSGIELLTGDFGKYRSWQI